MARIRKFLDTDFGEGILGGICIGIMVFVYLGLFGVIHVG